MSCWEASLKYRLGKMEMAGELMWRLALEERFEAITIQPNHLAELERLPVFADHRDPSIT